RTLGGIDCRHRNIRNETEHHLNEVRDQEKPNVRRIRYHVGPSCSVLAAIPPVLEGVRRCVLSKPPYGEPAMTIVDSHCHVSRWWFEPVESLVHQMDRHDVEQAVLIQIMGQTNNDYLFECVRRYPGRFAPVVLIDAGRRDACEALRLLAAR